MIFAAFACKKEKNKPAEEPAPAPASPAPTGLNENSARYVNFAIASQGYSYSPSINNVWTSSSGGLQTSPSLPHYYVLHTTHNGASNFYVRLSDSTRVTAPVSDNYYKSFVSVKNYPFAKQQYDAVGVYISVTNPANSVAYFSINPLNGNSFQNGSTFNISETFYYNQNGSSFLTALYKATVNCKLYNSSGDSIQLTNGEIVSTFSKF